jgi:hypothetical protein
MTEILFLDKTVGQVVAAVPMLDLMEETAEILVEMEIADKVLLLDMAEQA